MKVAVIVDTWFPFVGGGQVNAWETSKRLAKKGFEIEIITRNNGKNSLRSVKNLKVTKLGSYSQPNNQTAKVLFLTQAFLYVIKGNFKLVHAHAFLPGIIGRLLAITKGVPVIFTVHGTSIKSGLNSFISESVEKYILTKILYNKQITVSQDFLKLINVNKNVTYIPNGVDKVSLKSSKKVKSKVTTLIFVGRLHKQKNILNLIKAIGIVKKDINLKLLIVGEGEQKQEIKKAIKNLGLQKSVELLGKVSSVLLRGLYRRSDLFILPSIYEGQPLTLLEAWAAKLPVIVTKTGDCQYLVKENKNGFLINNPNDIKEISAVIKKALRSNNLSRLGENGYNLVKNNFSWDKSANLTQKIYESFE